MLKKAIDAPGEDLRLRRKDARYTLSRPRVVRVGREVSG